MSTRSLEQAIQEHNERMKVVKADRAHVAKEIAERRKLLDDKKVLSLMPSRLSRPVPLREVLAALEHEQWMEWSKKIADSENISTKRRRRWKELWIPYEELSETEKESDRRFADMVLKVLTNGGEKDE